MADNSFDNWLNDKLCKFLNNCDNDASVFLNYIISLLNEEDASLEDKKNSIEPILQDLDPSKSSEDVECLSNEILDKWSEFLNKSKDCSNKSKSEIRLNSNEEDPGDTIFKLIKEHKNQTVEIRHKTSDDVERYNQGVPHRIYQSDEEESEEENDSDLFKNTNSDVVLKREKQNREKLADEHLKQKERNKKDLQAQKEKEEERKKKAKQRASKVERRA